VKWALAALWLVLVGGLCACHERQAQQQEQQQSSPQEQQISPAVRAAVTAALGPHVSDSDTTEFLRSAKLATRTKHDTEVVAMLDEAVSLARSAVQDDYLAEKSRKQAKSAQWAAHWNEGMQADDKLVNAQRNEAKHSAEAAQGYEDESRTKKERAADLIQKLQAALR
jgi:hypothetical protein